MHSESFWVNPIMGAGSNRVARSNLVPSIGTELSRGMSVHHGLISYTRPCLTLPIARAAAFSLRDRPSPETGVPWGRNRQTRTVVGIRRCPRDGVHSIGPARSAALS